MTKKPDLTVVGSPDATSPSPPSTLAETGATLWRKVMTEYRVPNSGGLEMLYQIAPRQIGQRNTRTSSPAMGRSSTPKEG